LGRSPAVNGEGESIQLLEAIFSVVLYLVRAAHKFDSRPVTKWTCNKWRPAKSVRDMFLTRSVCFLCRHLRETMDPHPHRQGQSSIPE